MSQQREVAGALDGAPGPAPTMPSERAEGLVHQFVERDGVRPQLERARLDARHVEQVRHQPGQTVRLQLNELEQLGPVARPRAGVRPGAGSRPPS